MEVSTDVGKPARPSMLVNVPKLITAYFEEVPDPLVPEQQVLFGTFNDQRKIYTESLKGDDHLRCIPEEAQIIVYNMLQSGKQGSR